MSSTYSPPENVSDQFLEYLKTPSNVGILAHPDGKARMTGQCGDSIGVHVAMDKHLVKEVRVQPNGCAYTLVCAGAMSNMAQGLSVDEILELKSQDIANELGGLPEDHMHCASLALNALGEALAEYYANHLHTTKNKGK